MSEFRRFKVVPRKNGYAVLDTYSTKDIGVWADPSIARTYAKRRNRA